RSYGPAGVVPRRARGEGFPPAAARGPGWLPQPWRPPGRAPDGRRLPPSAPPPSSPAGATRRPLKPLRGALVGALDVLIAPVPADDLDPGMGLQPGGEGVRRALRQQVHRPAALQVAEDRAVALALLPGPVIDTQDPHRGLSGKRSTADPA